MIMSYEDDDTGIGMKNSGAYISPSVSGSLQGDGAENTGWSVDSVVNEAKYLGSKAYNSVLTSIDDVKSKLSGISGLLNNKAAISPTWAYKNSLVQSTGSNTTTTDWRVKVGVSSKLAFMESAMMAPIKATGGVVFPILPQINLTHTARYTSQPLTHSNYAAYFYEGSEVAEIQINGDFIVQNINDGKYLLAAIHFFKATTKMYFGNSSSEAPVGTPPPMVFLSGYGQYYFDAVTCVVKSFTHTMTQDVDYLPVPGPDGKITRLPTYSQIQVTLQPIVSRTTVASFDLNSFASGKLLDKGFL